MTIKHRVHDGIKDGSINKAEKFGLKKAGKHLNADVKNAMKDGKIDANERKGLHAEKAHLAQAVFKFRHNGQ